MTTIGTMTPDNLFADNGAERSVTRLIPAGTAVKRGDILSMSNVPIAASGQPFGIALDNIGANDTIRVCTVAIQGGFNANALFTGDTKAPMEWFDELRDIGIILRQPAP